MKLTHTAFFDTPLRKSLQDIIEAGFQAVDTKEAILKRVRLEGNTLYVDQKTFELGTGKLIVLGAGKCSGDALAALSDVLQNRMSMGFVIDVVNRHPGQSFEIAVGDHPFPSEQNIVHTKKLKSFLSSLTEEDRVIFIVSGGGTVLLCDPPPGFSSSDEAELIKTLFAQGATIKEMNTVRKHLSFSRGGFLATLSKAPSFSFIFSDVPYNDISTISSGPTVKDETKKEDAAVVIKKYVSNSSIGEKALEVLIETPKDDEVFRKTSSVLFMSNKVALSAMEERARALGFVSQIVTSTLEGEAGEIGQDIAKAISKAPSRTCFLYGGETTVQVRGNGVGGRNRHVALAALPLLSEGCLVASFASDGIDNGPRAGAFADSGILTEAKKSHIDPFLYLSNTDSGTFFERVGGYVESGPTGSNVADLLVALKL